MSPDIFAGADVIYGYTRKQTLADGDQVDANQGDLAQVSIQHFKIPVYMTRAVFELMARAVANKRYANDIRGVWHDICGMAVRAMRRNPEGSSTHFQVIITGAGRQSLYTLEATCGATDIDDAAPCICIMLEGED